MVVCKKTCKGPLRTNQISCNLFSPSLLRVPCLRTRYILRFGGRRRIPLCLALTVALTFALGGFLRFFLCSTRGGSSRPSASQLGVVFPGVFKCLLKLPRNWSAGWDIRECEGTDRSKKDTDNRSWRSGWPASRRWEDPLNSQLRPSRPNFCPSRYSAEASCLRRLDP
jgi:hypothetical protein